MESPKVEAGVVEKLEKAVAELSLYQESAKAGKYYDEKTLAENDEELSSIRSLLNKIKNS
jgi:hypothetical protein